RGAELARRRPDPGHAPVAATGGRCRWRASVMARAVPALRGGHAVAAGRRARLLVGLDRPRPPGLARPRQRDPAATRAAAQGEGRRLMAARTAADRRQRAMALPPLREADAVAIEAFLDGSWAESGLSRQTLASYRRDLEGLARWLDGRGGGLAGADRGLLF